MDIQLFQHHLLKRRYSLHPVTFVLLSNISCPYMWRFISRHYSVTLTYFFCLYTNNRLVFTINLSLKSGGFISQTLFFFRVVLAILFFCYCLFVCLFLHFPKLLKSSIIPLFLSHPHLIWQYIVYAPTQHTSWIPLLVTNPIATTRVKSHHTHSS